MKAIIILPTYNEKENIAKLLEAIFGLHIEGLEVLVVDDSSPDGTADIVEEMKDKYPVNIIKRAGKLGLGSAYIAGFKKALAERADYILEMDADLSHDPDDIPRLLEAAKNYDLVIGSRKIEGGSITGWGWWRKFMSNGAMWLSRLMLNLKAKDVTAGYRCFNKKVLESINLEEIKSNGYAFQEEMLYKTQKAGFSIKEIPVIFADRRNGYSKLSKKDIIEFFITIFKLKLNIK